jgi:hypothetical protein
MLQRRVSVNYLHVTTTFWLFQCLQLPTTWIFIIRQPTSSANLSRPEKSYLLKKRILKNQKSRNFGALIEVEAFCSIHHLDNGNNLSYVARYHFKTKLKAALFIPGKLNGCKIVDFSLT